MAKVIHPQVPDQELELAWEHEQEKFYRFKDISHLITKGRGIFITTYLQALERYRVTPEAFGNWMEAMRNALIPVDNKLRIDLAHRLLDQLREREQLFHDVNAAYKIQVLTTFSLEDDLKGTPSDEEIQRRIDLLKKKQIAEVWQMLPVKDILNVSAFLRTFSKTLSSDPLPANQAIVDSQNTLWMKMAGR